MDLEKIKNRVLSFTRYIKEIEVVEHNHYPYALIYPDFEALKEAKIINIQEELRWYAIELYNMEADEAQKIKGYRILRAPMPKTASGEVDFAAINELLNSKNVPEIGDEDEPKDEIYTTLKSYLSTITKNKIMPSSHLELDLGLDSFNYVELFVFMEQSFGIKIDEATFSGLMRVESLYMYILENSLHVDFVKPDWEKILDEKIDEKLVYSPIIMFAYKTVLFPLFKLYFRLEVVGAENIPSYPCIIAPSHQSMLDGFLIESILPYKVLKKSFFLAYKQVFGTTLLEPISKHGQSILIDANVDLKHTMQLCALPLREGNNLVIFPEGARTRDRKLLEFRPFFAMLSKTFNIPILPVVIDGSYEALQTGKIVPRPKKIRVTFLKPIIADGFESTKLAKITRDAIESELKRNPVSL
ncbi:1-acyl-sn-glycerol-3-phosphate acyltransferase [Sulfurimonas sp.]|uniref:1-acyl-sn-glycerol-3-phosphate acyltransferase n=1 Tax=Sulfurimonas sp. TaxID=2022749 RepID=UPI0025FEDF9B|nr:1-acyl-sn-glycerol-3-phosphate acyltransferase [Sulfurimonas sp.]MBW6487973.1 1-acyl-sn-glycerol-3-phosphate acyltransferase [Sulfurimonas sp.]